MTAVVGRTCPHCGQLLAEYRLGVRLSPTKARIFDIVARAGDNGIMPNDLFALVFTSGQVRGTLAAHMWQINETLEEVGYRIKGGKHGCYYLGKISP